MSLATHIAHTLASMQKSTTANMRKGNRKKTCDFLRFFSFYFVLFFMFQNFLLIGLECLLFVCLLSQLKSHETSCRFANEQPFSSFSSSSSHERTFKSARSSRIHTLVMFVFVTLNSVWTEMGMTIMMPTSVLCLCIFYTLHNSYTHIFGLVKWFWLIQNMFDFKSHENDWHIYSRQ